MSLNCFLVDICKKRQRFSEQVKEFLLNSSAFQTNKQAHNNNHRCINLEIPLSTVEYAVWKASEKGVNVVLNPAPVHKLPRKLFNNLYLITPNRVEAEMLTGVQITKWNDAVKAANIFAEMGIPNVIITLGSDGCLVKDEESIYPIEACKVTPVDTTAAGDTFNGALCVALAEGKQMKEAVRFASKAASIAVTRVGAQNSIPYRNELK